MSHIVVLADRVNHQLFAVLRGGFHLHLPVDQIPGIRCVAGADDVFSPSKGVQLAQRGVAADKRINCGVF